MEYYFDGDSNLYDKAEKEFSSPARVKQMGSIEGNVKIFVEDYVYTYLYQYGRSGGGREKLAALIGRHYVVNGQETVVISGAIQGKGTIQENGMERFSEETWEYIGGQMQTYFKGMSIVGWVHCQPGFGAFLMAKDESFHREYFKEKWQVLFVLDTVDKLDTFYIYNEEGTSLRQARGYFIYYDKNREMQEYMLENSMVRPKEMEGEEERRTSRVAAATEGEKTEERRRRKPTQEERMDAAKDIRRVLKKREAAAKQAKKEHDRLLAAVSCVLCVVCVSLGVAMMQSLDRLRTVETELVAMQTSYQTLAEDFEGVKVQQVFAVQQAETQADTAESNTEKTKKYIVEGGDSLGYISRKFYGDNSGVTRIMDVNGLMDADMIYEGQVLWIPEK